MPLTTGSATQDYYHIGTTLTDYGKTPYTFQDPLTLDLMNGVVLVWDYRYPISSLDLAILKDMGYGNVGSSSEPPTITVSGIAQEGQTLTAVSSAQMATGGLSSAVGWWVPGWQWQRLINGEWTNITGATSNTYTVAEADESSSLRMVVSGNGLVAYSKPTKPVIDVTPTLTVSVSGTPQEGQVLSATPNLVTDSDGDPASITYQWQRSADGTNWTNISGATASTYTAVEADENGLLRVAAAYIDDTQQSTTAVSSATKRVTDVTPSLTVSVSGNPQDGQLLIATPNLLTDDDDNAGGVTYQWQRSTDGKTWSNIPGATAASYVLSAADVNDFVQAVAAFTNDTGQRVVADSPDIGPVERITEPPSPESEIWFQHTGGQLAVWQVDGTAFVGGGPVGPNPGPDWSAVGKGAFYTGDTSDIIWQNQNGPVVIWQIQGNPPKAVGGAFVGNPGPSWHVKGTGDFNNDGHSDIMLQNDDGTGAIWEINGATFIGGGGIGNPGPSWHIEGTGDFYGDGHTDILWQNDNGWVAIWNMSGTNIIGGGGVGNPGPSWHIKGTGDFYGDGRTDILWQNDDGSVAIWNVSGTQFVGGGLVGSPGPSWHVKATGDFNNDNHTDIVLQHDNGTVVTWNMDGTAFIGGGVVGSPGPSWKAFDDPMQFIYSTSANETLTATAPTPDEFVFTSFAEGIHTIAGFNPVQDMIELSKAQFGSFGDVQAAITGISGGAMINLDNGSSLLLPGVDPASLHASNFALA